MQNGYIAPFNRLYNESFLDDYIFFDLNEVRVLTEEWIVEYNTKRPPELLINKTPYEWKMNILKKDYAQNKIVRIMGYLHYLNY
jgi:putative transposase